MPNSTRLRGLVRLGAVDGVEADERVELLLALALAGLADGAGDGVALAQPALAHLGERDVDVVRAGQVARGPDERVVVEDVEDAGDRDQDVVLADLGQGVALARREAVPAAAAVAVAVPVAPAAAAAATAAVEVVLVVAVGLVALAAWLPCGPGCPAPGPAAAGGCPAGRRGRRACGRRPGRPGGRPAGGPTAGRRSAGRVAGRRLAAGCRGAAVAVGRSRRGRRSAGASRPARCSAGRRRSGSRPAPRRRARRPGGSPPGGRGWRARWRPGRRSRRLALLDGLDQLALAHPGGAADAQLPGQALQLGEHHAGQAGGALAGGLGRRGVGGTVPALPVAGASRRSVVSDTDGSFLGRRAATWRLRSVAPSRWTGRHRGVIAHQVPRAGSPARSPGAPLDSLPGSHGKVISGEPRWSKTQPREATGDVVAGHRPHRGFWCDSERNTIGAGRVPDTRKLDRRVRSLVTLAPGRAPPSSSQQPPALRRVDRLGSPGSPSTRTVGPAPETTAARPAPRSARDQRVGAGHGRRAVALVQPVLGRGSSRSGYAGQRSDQQRGPAGGVRRVGVRHRAGSSPRAVSVDSSVGRHEHGGAQRPAAARGGRRARRRRRTRPGSARRAGRRRRCRGGPRSRWRGRAAASSSSRSAPPATSARPASSPATTAAAEEPRPRPCGMRLVQVSASGGCGSPSASSAACTARTTRCRASVGHRAGALAVHLDLDAVAVGRVAGGDDDLVVQVERQPEAVEARAEVRAGRRDPDGDRDGSCAAAGRARRRRRRRRPARCRCRW